jgi:catechol 2,3-dioxygenase-like lactoylglutathione lyase family enzyme
VITRLSHVTIFVTNQDEALAFYTGILGFEKIIDTKFGAFRWLTVAPAGQKDIQMALIEPRTIYEAGHAAKVEELMREGKLCGGVLQTDDCRKTFEELKAKGVHFTEGPTQRPFGIQATFLDNSNNWFSLTQSQGGPDGVPAYV